MAIKLKILCDKKIPKLDTNHICLAVINLDFASERWHLLSASVFKRV